MRIWLFASLLLAAAPATAATVFDNGVSDHANGYGFGGGRSIAEDFTLAGNTAISGGTLYQLQYGVGSLNYSFYASNGTKPGALLASGTASVTRTQLGTVLDYFTEYRTDFTFDTPFVALAGTEYWIAFGFSGSSASSVYWSTTAASASDNGRQGTVWGDLGYDFAFSLNGSPAVIPEPAAVPEPATWAMMIAGFGAVGAGLRRARREGLLAAVA